MTLWGGRFEGGPSDDTWAFTVDHSDRRLLEVDVLGSIAHARMLGRQGIIAQTDADRIVEGLESILGEARSGGFEYVETDEDVHTAVERRLGELIGDVAGRLHTGRSRNDQVATDLRLYLKAAGADRISQVRGVVSILVDSAQRHARTVVPSYTHLQQAQSTTLGNHLLAHAWALMRDADRFSDCVRRLDESPLGAGAGAGSSLPLDREAAAGGLGLSAPMANTLDAVAARDFVAEYTFACAQAMAHLSRLAEELVLWATTEFGWMTMSDGVSTGSSALPHKRNPDIAELVRGKAAVVAGHVTAILGLQKGLPLTYNRDLQEDKGIVFAADDTLAGSLTGIAAMLQGVEFHPPAPTAAVATIDLVDALVSRGVPFREAHRLVGEVVRQTETAGLHLGSVTDAELVGFDPRFQEGDAAILDAGASVDRRSVAESVESQTAELRRRLGES